MSGVRGYAEAAIDLRIDATRIEDHGHHREAERCREAAALLAGVAATLPPCPTCGGVQSAPDDLVGNCPDCSDGKVTIAQLAATWQAVHGGTLYDHMVTNDQADRFITGWFGAYDHLRSVRPPSPKEET